MFFVYLARLKFLATISQPSPVRCNPRVVVYKYTPDLQALVSQEGNKGLNNILVNAAPVLLQGVSKIMQILNVYAFI